MEQQPCWSLGRLISEVSRSHTDTPHWSDSSGRGIGPSKRPLPTQHNKHKKRTNNHDPGGVRTCSRNKKAAADLRAIHFGLSNYTLTGCNTSTKRARTVTFYLLFLRFQVLAVNEGLTESALQQKARERRSKKGWEKIHTGQVHNSSPPNILGQQFQ